MKHVEFSMKIALLPHAQNEPVPKPWFRNPLLVPVISVTAVVPSIMGHGSVGQHFGAICSILKLEATSTYHFNGICSIFERPICQLLVTPHVIRSTYMTHVDAENSAVHGDWSHVLVVFALRKIQPMIGCNSRGILGTIDDVFAVSCFPLDIF